jgi:uncharacterized protein YgbK (DUF1537 family)
VPVNPSTNRVIRRGKYYINESHVHTTSFANDPEFPISSSSVEEMLGKERVSVSVIAKDSPTLSDGVSVGEGETEEHLAHWARFREQNVLLAGGGSFFNALLAARFGFKNSNRYDVNLERPICFVSGTTFTENVERIREYSSLVSYMPDNIFSAASGDVLDYAPWLKEAIKILNVHEKVIIAIKSNENKKSDPNLLREKTAELVRRIIGEVRIGELLIEGGATAYSIIEKMGWHSFIPTEEIEQGIVRMKVTGESNLHLTIKPGSYKWPVQWKFN